MKLEISHLIVMLKKFINNPALFMTVSVMALLFFMFLLLFLFVFITKLSEAKSSGLKNLYYLNQGYKTTDPLLTAVPNLDDIITGPIITEFDPAIGPMDTKINIVIYTDFTCWYCYQAVQAAQQVQAEFAQKVRLIHKDFPNADKTYLSYQAAIAGRCAQEQNKFWEMSELLYQNYNQLSRNLFTNLAKQLNLNESRFRLCLEEKSDPAVTDLINDNIEEANALQITGIPLIYINDQQILGEASYNEIKKIIEKELAN